MNPQLANVQQLPNWPRSEPLVICCNNPLLPDQTIQKTKPAATHHKHIPVNLFSPFNGTGTTCHSTQSCS